MRKAGQGVWVVHVQQQLPLPPGCHHIGSAGHKLGAAFLLKLTQANIAAARSTQVEENKIFQELYEVSRSQSWPHTAPQTHIDRQPCNEQRDTK
jgi:hypothetical protein